MVSKFLFLIALTILSCPMLVSAQGVSPPHLIVSDSWPIGSSGGWIDNYTSVLVQPPPNDFMNSAQPIADHFSKLGLAGRVSPLLPDSSADLRHITVFTYSYNFDRDGIQITGIFTDAATGQVIHSWSSHAGASTRRTPMLRLLDCVDDGWVFFGRVRGGSTKGQRPMTWERASEAHPPLRFPYDNNKAP